MTCFIYLLQSERILSFIPPDGNFRLISYHISSQSIVAIPIYVRHNLSIKTGEQGRLDLTVGPKQTLGRTVEGRSFYVSVLFHCLRFVAAVRLEVLMPKTILNCSLIANQGKYNFDPVSKILHWDVGKIDVTKLPNIRGTVLRRLVKRKTRNMCNKCSRFPLQVERIRLKLIRRSMYILLLISWP